MKKRHQLYMGIIMAACSINATATPQAGNIDNFDGELTDYSIKRGNQTIAMGVYEPLESGDRIHVNKNHFIDIRQCGEVHRITLKDSPYRVQSKKCKVPGVLDNLWLNLKGFMQYFVTIKHEPSYSVHLPKSEEESPAMPILDRTFHAIPTLKAGKRALALQWFGGKSPYKVQITTAEKEILWQTEAKTQSVKTAKIHFKAGHSYWIIITAANYAKHPIEREFEAVTKLPDYPAQLQDKAIPENMRRTLQAGWLAKKDSVQWSFEAHQQLSDIAGNYGPARALQKTLMR
jgi:hypothetical protein